MKSQNILENQPEQLLKLSNELIESRLINHFKKHIGEKNRTSREEIFKIVTEIKPQMINNFSRFFWYSKIDKVIRKLRRNNQCFIIKKLGFYFVLQTEDEATYYKDLCKKAIISMENSIIRADEWVENESWKNIKESRFRVINPRSSVKSRIVRLWKK